MYVKYNYSLSQERRLIITQNIHTCMKEGDNLWRELKTTQIKLY